MAKLRNCFVAVLILPAGQLHAAKLRACVEPAPVDRQNSQKEVTLASGTVGMGLPPTDGAIADLQKALLKKFTVAAKCTDVDLQVLVLGTVAAATPQAQRGELAVDSTGRARGTYSGASMSRWSAYGLDVRFRQTAGSTQRMINCAGDDQEDAAKQCVKEIQDWLKLLQRLQ